MSDGDGILQRKLRRADALRLGGVAAATGVLAGCGVKSSDNGNGGGSTNAAPSHPSIDQEPATLDVFEWAGYEWPTYVPLKPYVKQYGKPKTSFLTSDDQALAKVRAGLRPDLVHPCIGYTQDWVNLGVVQPWDTSELTNFPSLIPAAVQGGQVGGKQYFIPADWGFSSPLYRSDKVDTNLDTWALFYDEKYKGKISWWDSLENLILAGYVNGVDDPWKMTDSEIEDMKKFLISKKHVVRNYWTSQTDMDNDFQAGNIWIAYAWAGSYTAAKAKGLKVTYMEPKEGRLSWFCGFVLMKDAKGYHHAHKYVDEWISKQSGTWLMENYAYGISNKDIDFQALIDEKKLDPDFAKVMHLGHPEALQEPNAHMDRFIPNRAAYNKAWDEVKAA
jgi:spermidine/putrescine transport system substrate-binding protein